MLLRRVRGFRLGRRLIPAWRWILRKRPRRYRRLDHGFRSPSFVRLRRWARSVRRRFSGDEDELETQLLDEDLKLPPEGYLAVYVGCGGKDGVNGAEPLQRYLVPLLYINHPLFWELLKEAEEQFGFHHPGGITIPCPVWRFERVQSRIASGCPASKHRLIFWEIQLEECLQGIVNPQFLPLGGFKNVVKDVKALPWLERASSTTSSRRSVLLSTVVAAKVALAEVTEGITMTSSSESI